MNQFPVQIIAGLLAAAALPGAAGERAADTNGQAAAAPAARGDGSATMAAGKTYKLDTCSVEMGQPSEVGRAAGHFWFSTLHPLDGKNVVCEVVTAADKAQGKWPGCLFLSRDGGASWQRAKEIASYGAVSTPLGPRKLLLMPYEQWPAAPGERRSTTAEGTVITLEADGRVTTEAQTVRFLGLPADLADYHQGELKLLTNGNILPLKDGSLLTTLYGTLAGDPKYHAFAMHSTDGGLTWRFLSVVGSWRDVPNGSEGPCESNTARLADSRLMCVYRVGSGRGFEYHRSLSADEGLTWTKPAPMPGTWSVEPQLVRLESGPLLLSGGRPGLFLWVSADGTGERWEKVNVAEHHNGTLADASLHYSEAFCRADASAPGQSTSYTGMKAVSPDEALICYDRLANGWQGAPGPWGKEDAVFSVRVRVRRR